MTVESRRV